MKTLDEVINALEICGHDESPKCPYFDTEHWCCCEDHMRSISPLKDDALHYLREFQGLSKMWNDKLDKEQENPPLTWDELKAMEGKPVWVEGQYPHSWCIVREVQKYMDGTEEIVLDGLNCKIGIGRKEKYGTGWQAYRKEHHEN